MWQIVDVWFHRSNHWWNHTSTICHIPSVIAGRLRTIEPVLFPRSTCVSSSQSSSEHASPYKILISAGHRPTKKSLLTQGWVSWVHPWACPPLGRLVDSLVVNLGHSPRALTRII